MVHRNWYFVVLLLILTACAPATAVPTPTPSLTPTITLTPAPTATPAPTPTATPIPPLNVTITWPAEASALAPIPLEASIAPPPGIAAQISAHMSVLDPEGHSWALSELHSQGGYRYVAEQPLQLPLLPLEGDWRVVVSAASDLGISGSDEVVFRPTPLEAHELGGLPSGVLLHIPRTLFEVKAQGDDWAGARVWRFNEGEIALWWAPGPIQNLQPDTAEMMLAATQPEEARPAITDSMTTTWQGRPAYLYHEQWAGATSNSWRGSTAIDAGYAEAWVIQAADYRLFVLRIRSLNGDIPPLMRLLADTFTFAP